MRILIIDDCIVNRKLLSSFFSPYGLSDTADNGGLGLDLFIKASRSPDPYSLICLDISMPGMNGYETLDAIRKFEETRNIPADSRVKVIIVTAFADEECLLKTYDKCQGYLIKPIRIQKLSEKLAALGFAPMGKEAAHVLSKEQREHFSDYHESVPAIVSREGSFLIMAIKPGSHETVEIPQGELEYFKNVVSGQLVARIDCSATELTLGQGLYMGPDGVSVFASENGRVSIEGSHLVLSGSIVFENGLRESLDFVGKVEILGSVADGVSLRASKGIVINGEAGACELKSEGGIEVQRFNGKGRGVARCGGNFVCDFIYGAKVEARESIVVRKEALNSELKAADSVRAGVLSGGSCMALNRIEIGRAGCPNDPGTIIKGGVNFHLLDKKLSLEVKLRDVEAKIVQIRQMLGPYADDIGLAVMLYEDKRKKIYEYSNELRRLDGLRSEIQREYDDIKTIPHVKSDPVIAVGEILHKGVRLSIGEFENTVEADLKGPFAVSEQFIRL